MRCVCISSSKPNEWAHERIERRYSLYTYPRPWYRWRVVRENGKIKYNNNVRICSRADGQAEVRLHTIVLCCVYNITNYMNDFVCVCCCYRCDYVCRGVRILKYILSQCGAVVSSWPMKIVVECLWTVATTATVDTYRSEWCVTRAIHKSFVAAPADNTIDVVGTQGCCCYCIQRSR